MLSDFSLARLYLVFALSLTGHLQMKSTADCANSIWSASLALFLVAAGDSEFGSAVRSFLTSYFPDCCRTLSCFHEVSPSEKDPPISHVTLFPSIAVPLLAAFAATDFRSVMILVPRQTGRQEDRQSRLKFPPTSLVR